MLKIGVTGGIGSGKSSVCRILKNLGVPVFTSDVESKRIIAEDQDAKNEILEAFGNDMFDTNGDLDKARLAGHVFNNPDALEKLNSILHPRVNKAFKEWVLKFERVSYVVKEAAILLESGSYHDLDKIVNVFAPREERIRRVMKRDKISKDDVMKRMRFQYSELERNDLADFIIMNEDDNKDKLLSQVMELHELLLNENPNKW